MSYCDSSIQKEKKFLRKIYNFDVLKNFKNLITLANYYGAFFKFDKILFLF